MKKITAYLFALTMVVMVLSCNNITKKDSNTTTVKKQTDLTAKDILGNPNYLAISYGGYREESRDIQPTIEELKNDMKLLSAMGIKILRTYNVQLQQAPNLLKAISQLKKENPKFEMYVMLGAWIDCLNAWTQEAPNHDIESPNNAAEIDRAVALANKYPDIVKVIAVGNEAMVKWAASYYVQPNVILKWVKYLQELKKSDKLPKTLWITSSDNFASWGGGDTLYHVEDLNNLIKAVDYISMHTYPMHDTHYNPIFWFTPENENKLSDIEKTDAAMKRSIEYAKQQYDSVVGYIKHLGINKPVHIGETGWASVSKGLYGSNGSKATDEYKQGLYYKFMRAWTNQASISCFYFEAFNEKWKDVHHPQGSENHFGLFTINGQAKYPIWDLVDQGAFDGLKRKGNTITKTYDGDRNALLKEVQAPPSESDIMVN